MSIQEKIISYTQNPFRELLAVASRTNTSINELDFSLLAFSTWYRFGDLEWIKITEKELVFFDDDTNFLKSDLQIKQEYKIEIHPLQNNQRNFNAVKLIANKTLTKIVAQIDTSSLIYHEKIALELLQIIYKKMLKLKFLIGIRIFDFKKNLINLSAKLKNNEIHSLVQIIVAKGIDPIPSQDECLIPVYKDKIKNYTFDEKRSGIIAVDENEIILKHLKAKNGKEGKDLNLHTLKVLEPLENKIKFSCTNAIRSEEHEEGVFYLSNKKGYVVVNDSKYDIANTIDFGAIDFKNVGIIKAGLDKNIKINIKFLSDIQDAVNSGVGIECEELHIIGSVAGNTSIHSKILKLEGTSQSKSKLEANEAYIKTHRGNFEGENIQIDLLEGGNIKAKNVKIKKSLGGNIEADFIYIENLIGNNSCIFYKNVTIERMEGSNNKFNAKVKIDGKNYEEELYFIHNHISILTQKIQHLKQNILANKTAISIIELKIRELKKSNQSIPPQYEKIIKDYNLKNQELVNLQEEEKKLLERKTNLEETVNNLQKTLLEASFINKNGKWTDMNEIKFEFIEPKQEIFFASTPHDGAKFIGIKKVIQNNQELIQIDQKKDYEEKDIAWLSASKE